VFKLLKILVGLVGLGAFVWWGLTIPLGDRTLFQHIAAIAHSKESRELVRGTKEKVADIKKQVTGHEGKPAAGAAPPRTEPAEAKPQERLTNADRHDMRKLLDSAHHKVARTN
jgi:hypothetical protein